MPSLADLLENRLKREIAFSGQAGLEDVPLLYPYRDPQQGDTLPTQQSVVAPAEEADPLQELLLSYGSPGLEAERSPLLQSPAPAAATSLDRLRDGGRGEAASLSAAGPVSGLAPSFSPELEGLLEDHFGFLQDPTSIGRLAPVIGPAMGIAESLQEEDYLGALMSALGFAAPAGLAAGSAVAAGYPNLAPSAAGQALITPDPISSLEGLFGRDGSPTGRSAVGQSVGGPGLAVGPEGYLSQTNPDPFAFLEQGPAPGPAPVDAGGALSGPSAASLAAAQGLSGPALDALGAGLQAHDVPHTVGAELAGFGYRSGPSGYQFRGGDEEDDDLEALAEALGVSVEAARSLEAALGPSLAAAVSGSAALGPTQSSRSRGGGDSGRSGAYRGSSSGYTGFEFSPERASARGRSSDGRDSGRSGRGGGGGGAGHSMSAH